MNSLKKTVYYPHLSKPSLKDNTADAERLILSLKKESKTSAIEIDFEVLKNISNILKKHDYNVKCLLFPGREKVFITGVCGAESGEVFFGAAIDLGTTNIVISLINLETRKIAAQTSFKNPQIKFGADILSRLHYASKEEGVKELHNILIESIDYNIERLCLSCGFDKRNVYSIALAGNTGMTHLFLGITSRWLIREPYIPVVNKPEVMKAGRIRS